MLTYLKDHIIEEVDGAIDYMKKALEYKGTSEGCMFRKMSEMELEHANYLTHMFHKTEKPEDMTDADYAAVQKAVLDKYVTAMGQYEAMKKLYWKNND